MPFDYPFYIEGVVLMCVGAVGLLINGVAMGMIGATLKRQRPKRSCHVLVSLKQVGSKL